MKLPVLSGNEVIKGLLKAGFQIARQKGSHVILKHIDGRTTVVPIHPNRDVGRGLLRRILKEAELESEEFIKLF